MRAMMVMKIRNALAIPKIGGVFRERYGTIRAREVFIGKEIQTHCYCSVHCYRYCYH